MGELSNLFASIDDPRKSIDQSSRKIMLIMMKEIIKNKIEIEALKNAVKMTATDSNGDTHDHFAAYSSGLAPATAKYASDLADLNIKTNDEETINEEWTMNYKKALDQTTKATLNGQEQMKSDSERIKAYDTYDQGKSKTLNSPLNK